MGGARGGSRKRKQRSRRILRKSILTSAGALSAISYRLSQEVHSLMRVMWSGKWAVVTPHAVLNAVWRLVPAFRGYSQQDAQEFLW